MSTGLMLPTHEHHAMSGRADDDGIRDHGLAERVDELDDRRRTFFIAS